LALICPVVIGTQWAPPGRCFPVTLDWPGRNIETSGQHDLRFIGDEVPEDDECHIEYFKSLTVKAVKQAEHRKTKDGDGIRLFVE
jgi:hypothetical protein